MYPEHSVTTATKIDGAPWSMPVCDDSHSLVTKMPLCYAFGRMIAMKCRKDWFIDPNYA